MGTQMTLVGNLTKDFELKTFDSGSSILNGSLAVNERRFNKQTNEWEDLDPSFFNLVCFESIADNVLRSLSKGTRVIVTGQLRVRNWEKDDKKGTSVELVVDEIGPSLRWATAEVVKNPKSGSNGTAHQTESDYLSGV